MIKINISNESLTNVSFSLDKFNGKSSVRDVWLVKLDTVEVGKKL